MPAAHILYATATKTRAGVESAPAAGPISRGAWGCARDTFIWDLSSIEIKPTALREPLHLLSGGPEVLAALRRRIASGDGAVMGELYEAAYHPLLADLTTAAKNDRGVAVLLNPHLSAPSLGLDKSGLRELRQAGAVTTAYNHVDESTEFWGHAKPWIFADKDKPLEAWVGNLAWAPQSLKRNELTTVLTDARAGAVHEWTSAAIADDPDRMLAAAENAAQHGVLVDDPRTGAKVLADQMRATIIDAKRGETLHIATKGIDDTAMTQLIVDAKARGVNVDVYVRDLAPDDADMLEQAAVTTRVLAGAFPGWRVNMIAGRRDATLGTAFLWNNMTRVAGGTSRDIGLYLQGDARDQVIDAVRGLEQVAGRGHSIRTARALGFLTTTS
ncbi:MAG: hypothetical protein H7123_07970 [Thermoleophilia bacterium]|nr:hypothetical protein [Thermoleophilia bacterium]